VADCGGVAVRPSSWTTLKTLYDAGH
jgi:hypothetical protein